MVEAIEAGLGTVIEALLAKGVKYNFEAVSCQVLKDDDVVIILFISWFNQFVNKTLN